MSPYFSSGRFFGRCLPTSPQGGFSDSVTPRVPLGQFSRSTILGVDHLFVDEFQAYKNLEAPTKMERVAGVQSGGSERAFDLYMKARYLHERHPGHGLTAATGT